MLKFSFIIFTVLYFQLSSSAQKIDSIYVHLYTDSLKKGTFNYINIDGMLPGGNYIPLDSSHIIFSSSYGSFSGNSLYIDPLCKVEKIMITAVLRSNKSVKKSFEIYIKKNEDPQQLRTEKQIMEEMRSKGKKG